jgi:DNA-binding Xre family transcriptional regulator
MRKLVILTNNMQTFEAFDKTLSHFDIKNRELQNKTGVNESSISRFRRGERDLQVATLEKLIQALPHQAQQFYYFNCMVSDFDDQAIASMLYALSVKLRDGAQARAFEAEKIPA